VAVDYKTHILVGVRTNGDMTVIADWPYVPSRPRCSKKSTRPGTGTSRSRCAHRPQSSHRATKVRQVGGIGHLGPDAG
jgi:hypothetical protein